MGLEGHDAMEPQWDWAKVRALCLRHARQILGATALAEDAAQEATLRAWRNRHTCRTPDAPAAWLAAIARREALRAMPDRRQMPAETLDDLAVAGPDEPFLDRVALRDAVRDLDPRDRQLVVGHYWLDRSYAELADELGIPSTTVGVRLHRVRLRLRRRLVRA